MSSSPTPCLSVLMPAYNTERYIEKSVRSILDQTFRNFEFLIVDDGSSDRTGAILDRLAAEDARIRLTRRANGGYVSALNLMLNQAQGEYIARMDADDIALPERFERQVEYLNSHPECLAVGSVVQVIDPDGDVLCEWFPSRSHEELDAANLEGSKGSALCHPSVLMRRIPVLELGGYREAFYSAEDLDLWLRLAEHGRLANLAEPMLQYRCHPSSIGHTQKPRQWNATRSAIAEARQRRGLPPAPASAPVAPTHQSTKPVNPWNRWGWWALQSGFLATARKLAWTSLTHQPFSLQSWRLLYCAIRGR